MIDTRHASRKFVITSVLVLYAMTCNALGVRADPEWLSFLTWIVGLYITGNVGAALVDKVVQPLRMQKEES